MVQIINDPYASLGGGFAHSFGTGLQQGLGSGLQALAQLKMNQLQQRQQATKSATGLQALGFTPEQASALSQLPEALQGHIVKQKILEPQGQAFLAAINGQGAQQVSGENQQLPQEQLAGGKKPLLQPGLTPQQYAQVEQIKTGREKLELSKQKELDRRQESKIRRETEVAEKYIAPKRQAFTHAKDLRNIFDEYEQLLPSAYAGPVMGRLGQFSESTSRLNQLASQILGHEILSAQGGGRGSDLLRNIIKSGKIDPTQPIGTQRKYIEKAKQALNELALEESAIDKIVEEKGYAPANIKNLVNKEVKSIESEKGPVKVTSQLPSAGDYSDDTIIEIDGYQFKKAGNDWDLIKKD